MKYFIAILMSLVVVTVSGCMHSEMQKTHDIKSGNDNNKWFREVDIAIAIWYTEQAGAFVQLKYILGMDLALENNRPLNHRSVPSVILQEQRNALGLIDLKKAVEVTDKKNALAAWKESQLNAANAIRTVLRKKAVTIDSKHELGHILDIQDSDISDLNRRLKDLGENHW